MVYRLPAESTWQLVLSIRFGDLHPVQPRCHHESIRKREPNRANGGLAEILQYHRKPDAVYLDSVRK